MGEDSSVRSSRSRRSLTFGRSKRNAKNNDNSDNSDNKMSRRSVMRNSNKQEAGGPRKSFRRIRGLLTGESRRERRARKAAARRARGIPADDASRMSTADDASTVYGVDVQSLDERRTVTPTSSILDATSSDPLDTTSPASPTAGAAASNFKPIQVILLLMDPVTRRFELLQLEFDSNKAVVDDVLAQVPHSVTEDALRKKDYVGICDRNGTKLVAKDRLSDICKNGADIFVGVPEGISEAECARLARPILSDDKVLFMLKSSGIDVTGLKESAMEKTKDTSVTTTPTAAAAARSAPQVTPSLGSADKTAAVAAAAAAAAASSSASRDIKVASDVPVSAKPAARKSSKSRWLLSLVLAVLLGAGLQLLHLFLIAPVEPGQVLMPGLWKVKCGLLSLLPSCENGALEMGFNGVLTYYGPSHEKEWVMQGHVCNNNDSDGGDEGNECVRGLLVKPDGTIVIGGKKVNSVTSFGNANPDLAPWPFEKPPKTSVVRRPREN